FAVFGSGIGVEQTGGPDPHLGKAVLHPDGADGQTRVDAAVEIDAADRTRIPASRRALMVLDELHRPELWRSGHRHGPRMGKERIERVEARPQHAFDMIDGVEQLRVGLDLSPRQHLDRTGYADARLVVTIDIGAHVELELVLLRVQELANLLGVADRIGTA